MNRLTLAFILFPWACVLVGVAIGSYVECHHPIAGFTSGSWSCVVYDGDPPTAECKREKKR